MEAINISAIQIPPLLCNTGNTVNTKPIYSTKTFFWEIHCFQRIMTDGVQKAISCDFEVLGSPVAPIPTAIKSTWRLALDLDDVEPAFTVHKISPVDKIVYFRLLINVMKNTEEAAGIINHPDAKLFYDSSEFTGIKTGGGAARKFSMHKQLDYGSSYVTWCNDVLKKDSLLLKVDFETCQSICY